MKENKLTILINKPASSVFNFTTEPDNTPLWIHSIVSEKVNERPITLGTQYLNTDKDGKEHVYEVSEILEGEYFELKSIPPHYTVRYTYRADSLEKTELEYLEWVDNGELEVPFEQKNLEKLKLVLEAK